MKKIFTAIILLCALNAIGQNAYYDAKKIANELIITNNGNWSFNTEKIKLQELGGILRNYLPGRMPESEKNSLDAGQIFSLFKDNPFIGEQIIPLTEGNQSGFDATTTPKSALSLSSIGATDVTNIADGLARFLIKRGKEELNIAFFQRMKEFLDKNVEARTLFPSTTVFLGSIAAYRYSELLQSLREAFYKDVSNLIVNLNLLIDLPKYQELLKALPEIRLAIRSAKIISELSQPGSSIHPAILINQFAQLDEWGEMNINLKSSWRLLDKISESVRKAQYDITAVQFMKADTVRLMKDTFAIKTSLVNDNLLKIDTIPMPGKNLFRIDNVSVTRNDTVYNDGNENVAWIKFSDFNANILRNTVTLKIYLGLLYQKMDGITFMYDSANVIKYKSVQQFMRDNSDNIFRLADLIENFLLLANDVQQSIEDIKGLKNKVLTNDDYYTYIEKAINVFDYGFKVANTIKEGIANDRYIVMARNANNLYKNIYTKNYNAAVMNSYLILDEVLSKSMDALNEKALIFKDSAALNTFITTLAEAGFMAAYKAVENSVFFNKDSLASRSKLVEDILKYGNVIASIVKAESPEEAEAAIEAAVLPAGSSSIKKNSAVNISLNAYIGGYFGKSSNTTDEIDGNNSKIGVTAPVGIAFSKGLGHYKNGSPIGALSLFATLIDVGAIAGFRLNDDSTALDQQVTLSDIFTPGGYLVYGFGLPFKGFSYIPLSIGYGWQYGSKLYIKKDGKLEVSDKSRWRSNWFIAIDIPLANFWTRNYKKKG